MKTKDFYFDLPDELIAQHPTDRRGDSRLLVLHRNTGAIEHSMVRDLSSHLPSSMAIVLNDSKVRKARLYAQPTDGVSSVEFLLLRSVDGFRTWEALVRRARRQKVGRRYGFPGGVTGEIVDGEGAHRIVEFDRPVDDEYLEVYGAMPLPPYIKRSAEAADDERYQTVYAKTYGSVAAPTAGLHFTPELLTELRGAGHLVRTVTLHVGFGTFAPVRSDSLEDHEMHSEAYEISPEVGKALSNHKSSGGGILAVGTTSVRTLESAARTGAHGVTIPAERNDTSIFIYPPYQFRAVDALFTNFHTPESTLMMLVSAFAGIDRIRSAYEAAVAQRYRFFSYGDAMLIL